MASGLSAGDSASVRRDSIFQAGNLAFCCAPCNEAKGVFDADEFTALWQVVRGWDELARTSLQARLRAGGKAMRR